MSTLIENVEDTRLYKSMKAISDYVFKDQFGGVLFCVIDKDSDPNRVLMQIFRMGWERKIRNPGSPHFRVIYNAGTVNWFKYNHKTYQYLI